MAKKKNKKKNNSSTPKKENKIMKTEELAPENSITLCLKCSTPVTRKYCPNCGEPVKKKEEIIKQEESKEEIKVCSNCATPVTRKYCPNCGAKVEEEKKESQKLCLKCSTPVPGKYCPNCGEDVVKDVSLEEQKEELLPPVSSMGIPGVVPIPNAGIEHNAFKQYSFSTEIPKESLPKKSKRNLVITCIAVLFIVAIVTVVLLFINQSKKEKTKGNSNSLQTSFSNTKVPDSNRNEEKPDDTLVLSCTLTSNYEDGIKSISKTIYTFQDNKIIKSLEEEILEFNEKSMQYYDIYLDNVKEELLNDSYYFDNTTLELIKTQNSVGLSYTTDLTVDSKNSNNNLELLGTTYKSAKKELENEGYQCK